MNFKAALVYWKLAIFRVTGKALMAIALSIAQGLNGVEWNQFTPTERFVTVVLAIGTGWAIVDAFPDQTLSTIQRDPSGLGIPGAEVKQRTETRQTTNVTSPAP